MAPKLNDLNYTTTLLSTTASNLTTKQKTTVTINSTQTMTTANVTTLTPGNITTAVPSNATTGTFEPTTGDHALCNTCTFYCSCSSIFREGRSPQTRGRIFLNVLEFQLRVYDVVEMV